MLKVNNKKTTQHLAASSFRANKMRNTFAVIAIVLTTVLFTGLFTVAGSLLSSMEESTMRQVGTSAHGGFKYLSMEQYEKLKTHPSIKESSYSVVLGIAENKALAKRPTEIRYTSGELGAKTMFSIPTTGRLPQNDNEIALDTIVLQHLGIKAKLGEEVTLEYSLSGEKQTDKFTLVGFWQGDPLMMASQAWLNQSYVEEKLQNYISTDENDVIGKINADVNFASSFQIEKKLQRVIADSGYTADEIAIGVNWAYTGNRNSADFGTIVGGVAIILMIVFCGYLMISNVFYISVTKDIRFYGMLKTIGTTGKQIAYLIRAQALLLCIIGIPLGLIAGYFVGVMLTPAVLSILNTNTIKISMTPIIFIAAALFAVLTVIISTAKPSKVAARVSPIEALRTTDGAANSKKTTKKSGGISLWRMAWANVFRSKKKAILVAVSLSLSLVLLNCAYSMANSFDMDKYLSGRIGSDFAIGDVSYFNVHMNYDQQETLTGELLTEIFSKDGVHEISNIYFDEPLVATDPRLKSMVEIAPQKLNLSTPWAQDMNRAIENPMQVQHIYGLDALAMKKMTIFSGVLDLEKLKTGNYVIAAPYDPEGKLLYYEMGDKVSITNAAGDTKEYEVLAVASLPYNISAQHSHPITPEFFLDSEVFLRDIAKKSPMLTTLEVSDAAEPEMERFLADYATNIDQSLQYNSKTLLAAEYKNTQSTYKSVGLILSLLVAFIGVMNFINTIATSILSRKCELAMLQSIGMTGEQTQTLLVLEGLLYTGLATLLVMTIGSMLGYFGVHAFMDGGPYFTTRFTVLPSLLCLPILAIISALVPYISGRIVGKSSIVERLREVE